MSEPKTLQLGIIPNIKQFSLLVLINAFVGAMVGMERSILPLIAEKDFGITSHSVIFSFLISFGIVKGISNLFAGRYSDVVGRKKLLVAGWLAGIPVPFILMFAPSWSWVVAGNILLGINQGLCWSATVIMKIDLAGPKRRGLAMGLNEFAGYLAVAGAAYASALLAVRYGFRPYPFYLGVACSLIGLILSLVFAKETHHHAKHESALTGSQGAEQEISFKNIFLKTSWQNKKLFSCSQAGLINNLNDGMAWGLFPLFFISLGFSLNRIGVLAGVYPATWGIAQLFTGAMSDKLGRKWIIAVGMWIQAIGLWFMLITTHYAFQLTAAVLLGLGTAMVYPTLLAAVSDTVPPGWRASAVGVYRLWRDLGYAIGAVLSGGLADTFGTSKTILIVGVVTFFSGIVVAFSYVESNNNPKLKGKKQE